MRCFCEHEKRKGKHSLLNGLNDFIMDNIKSHNSSNGLGDFEPPGEPKPFKHDDLLLFSCYEATDHSE